MVQRIVAIFTDDLMGEEAYGAATHTFALKGVSYEVVLEPGTLRADARGFRAFRQGSPEGWESQRLGG